jgi:nicotinamidase/pyrazinamidase
MNAIKFLFKIALIPAGLFLLWFGIVLARFILVQPTGTTGEKINLSDNPNKAILVIDLFNYNTRKNSGILNVLVDQKRADLLICENNKAIDELRSNLASTIFIYQIFEKWTPKSLFRTEMPIKGSFKAQIDPRLHRQKDDPEFNKPAFDAFSNPDLQRCLINRKAGTLFITGTAAEACVYATACGARNRGYRVYVIDEATYFFNLPNKDKTLLKFKSIGAEVISLSELPTILSK